MVMYFVGINIENEKKTEWFTQNHHSKLPFPTLI